MKLSKYFVNKSRRTKSLKYSDNNVYFSVQIFSPAMLKITILSYLYVFDNEPKSILCLKAKLWPFLINILFKLSKNMQLYIFEILNGWNSESF